MGRNGNIASSNATQMRLIVIAALLVRAAAVR